MSQYPPSYPPPSPYPMDFNYYIPAPDLLAPARRAGIAMFVLAAFCMLCGSCVGVAAWAGPVDQLIQQIQQSGLEILDTGGQVSAEQFVRIVLTVISAIGVVLGVVLVVLGIFVRRGAKWAAIVSLVVCIPALLIALLDMIRSLALIFKTPALLPGAFIALIPMALLGLVVVWLFQALRAAPHIAAQQQMMMAQMWQYQQQQVVHGGYNPGAESPPPAYGGYAPPPPPYAAPPSSSPGETGAPKPPDSTHPPPDPPSGVQ